METTTLAGAEAVSDAGRHFADLVAQAVAGTAPEHRLPHLFTAPFGPWTLRDGEGFADLVTQRDWEILYAGLSETGTLPGLAELQARAQAVPEGIVPIGLLNLRYKRPNRRLARALAQAEQDKSGVVLPDDVPIGTLFEEKTAFAATSLLAPHYWCFERQPDVHVGLALQFVLAPDLYIADGPQPDRVTIDCDDGLGPRDAAFGAAIPVAYESAGERRIVLQAHFGARVLTGSFLFIAAEPRSYALPEEAASPKAGPHFSVPIPATIPYGGRYYHGTAHVYKGRGNDSARGLRHPILLAEGFPGGAQPDTIYDIFNGATARWARNERPNNLADELRWRGYDVVILIFSTRGAPLQGNAFVYLAALEWLRNNTGGRGYAAAGGSMGGLIARYALAYAETNDIPVGNVTMLMTFDSPHCGANVPLAVQAAARYFRFRSPGQAELFDTACAKQMLMHQYWYLGGVEPIVKRDFIEFYAELERLGKNGGGFPGPQIKKYALCNGAIGGTAILPPAVPAMKVWRDSGFHPYFRIDLRSTPNNAEPGRFTYAECSFTDQPDQVFHLDSDGKFRTRDGCSGGAQNFFEQVYEATYCSTGSSVPHRICCFVPAYSALGIRGVDDAYTFKAQDYRGKTPFDDWWAPTVNQQHCTIDKHSMNWVLSKFPAMVKAVPELITEPAAAQ